MALVPKSTCHFCSVYALEFLLVLTVHGNGLYCLPFAWGFRVDAAAKVANVHKAGGGMEDMTKPKNSQALWS